MSNLTIAKLAQAGGVGVETVRYYQRRGLMNEPERPTGSGLSGSVRRYGEDDIRQLRFIKAAQTAGFTLGEIGELLTLNATDDRSRVRELARARVALIDSKIAELQTARAALSGLADHCASSEVGACPILTTFELSGDRLV